jgi:8-hydroxy-5-deazaflavin:NADPH oxidoreductase
VKEAVAGLTIGHTTSGGEQVARWAAGARVVKAFNTIGAVHMAQPTFGTERASMFLCGDDVAAKGTVAGLAREPRTQHRVQAAAQVTGEARGR